MSTSVSSPEQLYRHLETFIQRVPCSVCVSNHYLPNPLMLQHANFSRGILHVHVHVCHVLCRVIFHNTLSLNTTMYMYYSHTQYLCTCTSTCTQSPLLNPHNCDQQLAFNSPLHMTTISTFNITFLECYDADSGTGEVFQL